MILFLKSITGQNGKKLFFPYEVPLCVSNHLKFHKSEFWLSIISQRFLSDSFEVFEMNKIHCYAQKVDTYLTLKLLATFLHGPACDSKQKSR